MKKFFQDHNWRSFLDQGLRTLSDAADVAVHLKSNPGVVGTIAVASKIVNSMNEFLPKGDSFADWYLVIIPGYKFVFKTLFQMGLLKEQRSSSEAKRYLADLQGVRIGWTCYQGRGDHVTGPYRSEDTTEQQAIHVLRVFIWQTLGSRIVLASNRSDQGPRFSRDDASEVLASKTADDIWERQRKFLKVGYSRCVLLHGEPGVGKSNIIRYVAQKNGGLSFRIRAQELHNARCVGEIVDFLNPTSVLIDDLDRSRYPSGFIDELDALRSKVNLILVTANTIGKFDGAILRRFDDWYEIKKLDARVMENLTCGIPNEVVSRLEGMPVTYLERFRRMVEVLGQEEAEKELDSVLAHRSIVLTQLKRFNHLQTEDFDGDFDEDLPKSADDE